MSKSIVFMFSGQGSQYYQMGKELFKHHPVFRKWMLKIDAIFEEMVGRSIVQYLYDENNRKSDPFTRIIYSSPAIFMVEYALSKALSEKGIRPDCVLGASLGEFTASVVAGVICLEDAIDNIVKIMMTVETMTPKGNMVSVLNRPGLYYDSLDLRDNSEIAAINFDSHFVVACKAEKLWEIEAFFRHNEIGHQVLAVSHAFHSSHIDPAENVCKDIVGLKTFSKPEIPMISCAYTKRVEGIDRNYFWDVLRKPILFQRTIRNLEKEQDVTYFDLGPSGTLATFIKYNLSQDSKSEAYPVLTIFGQDMKNLNRITKRFKSL